MGGSALIGAALIATSPLAFAKEDPAANPPNCSAADFEGVQAGVDASTSAYLFTHQDINDYMSTLRGMSRQQVGAKMQDYLAGHPTEQAEVTAIRQPLVDIKARCGQPPSP